MIIDVPVLVDFDTTKGPKNPIAITLRFDMDNGFSAYSVTDHYPPRANADWTDGTSLFDLMPEKTFKKIERAARRYPIDYCADEAEGEKLQEEADEAARADGQFGVGG